MKNAIFSIIIGVFFCIVAAGLLVYAFSPGETVTDAPEGMEPQNTPHLQALFSPTAKSTTGPVATPTATEPQYAFTAVAMQMTVAAENARAAGIQATAIVDAAKIAADASDRKSQSDERLAKYAIHLQELENKNAEIQYGMMVMAAERDRLNIEAEKVKQDGEVVIIRQIMGWLVAALTVVFIGVIIWRFAESRQVIDYRESADSLGDAAPWPEYAAGIKTDVFAKMATPDELRKIGNAVLSGRPFSHAQIVRKMQIMSESNFEFLQDEFVIRGLASWRNHDYHKQGCTITDRGALFFRDIGCVTTSPPMEQVAKQAKTAGSDTIPSDFTPL